MISFVTELSSSKFDYRLDKPDRFFSLLPYLYPKISGEWRIELVGIDIKVVREILDYTAVPDYINLSLVLAQDVLALLQAERPEIVATKKTIWEYYNDLIAKLPVLIESKAASMLYHRLPKDRILIRQTLDNLVTLCEEKGTITVSDVKGVTLNHRVYYANQVIRAFAEYDKNRWRIFDQFELDLGTEYAFYALRKYVRKLLKEKSAYLVNKTYKDSNVECVDTYMIMFFIDRFNRYKPKQLLCIFSEFDSIRKGDIIHAVL